MSKSKTKLEIVRLPHAAGLPLPAYQSAGAAGLDLMAAVPEDAPVTLAPGQRTNVPTGLSIALPPGTEGQVRPRSGLAARHGVTVLNSPGTVDSDYRGEIQVILVNLGLESFSIARGLRIAQLVIAVVELGIIAVLRCRELRSRGIDTRGRSLLRSREREPQERDTDRLVALRDLLDLSRHQRRFHLIPDRMSRDRDQENHKSNKDPTPPHWRPNSGVEVRAKLAS